MRHTIRTILALPLVAACVLAASLAVPTSVRAEPHRYVIDPTHFTAAFLVQHLGFAATLGQFLEGGGSFTFDEETRLLTDVRADIKTASVFSNVEARDQHLRSKDFLWADDHPSITFVGTKAEPTGERTGKVHGDLTIRGVTRPVVLDVTWIKSGHYPFGDKHYAIGISARTTIKRSEFGMTYAVEGNIVGDAVDIILEFEAIRQDG